MATTLASLIDRVEALLMDSSNVIWDTGTITEGIRLAVGEYSTANEAAITVQNLDGAGSTTLPAIHDSLVVLGAAGYAAVARAADRAESFTPGSQSADLKAWGEARLKEFRAMLGFVFPGYWVALAAGGGAADPGKTAAEVALLAAQELLTDAEAARTAALTGLVTAQAGKVSEEEALLTAQAGKAAEEEALLTAQAALANAQKLLTDAEAARTAALELFTDAQTGKITHEAALLTAQAGLIAAQELLADAQTALVTAQAGRVASEQALLTAQASLAAAQAAKTAAETAEVSGREARAQAAALRETAGQAAEAARKKDLRESTNSPWGTWTDAGSGL